MKVSGSSKQLRGHLSQDIICRSWGGTKGPWLCLTAQLLLWVLFDCYFFLHVLASMIKFVLWLKFFCRQKRQAEDMEQLCPAPSDPVDYSMPGLPVHHQLPELAQTHVHWVSDAIQSSHTLLSPSPPAFSLCQHQGLFQWVSSSHQVAKVLELQLQHQPFQWIFRTDFL